MSARTKRRFSIRKGAAAITAVAVGTLGLVASGTGVTSAAPFNTTVQISCRGADAATTDLLNTAGAILGGNRVGVQLNISGDVPANAGIDEEIDATFNWTATMSQTLIDQAAGLINQLSVTNISVQQQVRGPATPNDFSAAVPGPIVISPQKGVAASMPIGEVGGTVTTTGGGIVTYRVGTVSLSAGLAVAGQNMALNLTCAPQGSNLIARTTVRDPDAPVFSPELIELEAMPGETVTQNLLDDVVQEGKTPLMPETLEIVEPPAAGQASITDGVFSFTAPDTPGNYSTTVQVCGAPKAEGGIAGVTQVENLLFGDNWGVGGIPFIWPAPRPVAFSLKFGDEETPLIWAAEPNLLGHAQFGFPATLPLGGKTPTAENWAPADNPGLVADYMWTTDYKRPSAPSIQAALEALPSVGAGNVSVTEIRQTVVDADGEPVLDPVTNEERTKFVGYSVTYLNDLEESDLPDLEVGQWYGIPPQEALDQLIGLAGALGGGDDEEEQEAAPTIQEAIDAIEAAVLSGAPITDAMWDDLGNAFANALIEEILANMDAILAFINSLFPNMLDTIVVEQGEEAVPPQPLCAQGIIDVSVLEVQAAGAGAGVGGGAGAGSGAEVGGRQVTRGDGRAIGFVG